MTTFGAMLQNTSKSRVFPSMRNQRKGKLRRLNKLHSKQDEKEKEKNVAEDTDLSGTQLKKWVINTTDRELTKPQTTLLSLAHGLNFAVLVEKIPNEE